MSIFVTSIVELSQNFFKSDPLTFNQYFAITPDYQKHCLRANLPTRFTITLAKEAMLIHDMAIHLLAGGCKLTIGGIKGICAIASGILGLETDHQTPSKQALVHFGFACVYAADIFASITNINNTYPQYLMDKTKGIFTRFLETSNKGIIVEYIVDPETEKALKEKQTEAEEKELALQEEQRKAREQEKLLKKTQQELEKLHNSDFISEEAQEVADTTIYDKHLIKEEPAIITTSFDSKLTTYNPLQYTLTHLDNDDDTADLLDQEEDNNFWFEDEFSEDETLIRKEDDPCKNTIISSKEQLLEEEKKVTERFPFKDQEPFETKKINSPKKVSRSPKKNISPHNTSPPTSARARGLQYANKIRIRSRKTSLANS